jgi:hypothetical protein
LETTKKKKHQIEVKLIKQLQSGKTKKNASESKTKIKQK